MHTTLWSDSYFHPCFEDEEPETSLPDLLWVPPKADKRHFFPGGASGKEPACQCRRPESHGFDPWVILRHVLELVCIEIKYQLC